MPQLTIYSAEDSHTPSRVLTVEVGANLRRTLLDADLSPYAALTQRLNCGGRGLCATCGVWVVNSEDEPPTPDHWHDWLAQRYGYPRLSCQIAIDRDLTVYLIPDKRIWGDRKS